MNRSVNGNEDLFSDSQYTGVTNKSDTSIQKGEVLSKMQMTGEGYKESL